MTAVSKRRVLSKVKPVSKSKSAAKSVVNEPTTAELKEIIKELVKVGMDTTGFHDVGDMCDSGRKLFKKIGQKIDLKEILPEKEFTIVINYSIDGKSSLTIKQLSSIVNKIKSKIKIEIPEISDFKVKDKELFVDIRDY